MAKSEFANDSGVVDMYVERWPETDYFNSSNC